MRFLEQRLQPILELHAITGDLVLARRITVRQSRCSVGHKAQGQLLRHQAFHQPLGVGKVPLTPAGSPIRLRLGEMSVPREAARRPVHGVRAAVLVRAPPTPAASTARSTP